MDRGRIICSSSLSSDVSRMKWFCFTDKKTERVDDAGRRWWRCKWLLGRLALGFPLPSEGAQQAGWGDEEAPLGKGWEWELLIQRLLSDVWINLQHPSLHTLTRPNEREGNKQARQRAGDGGRQPDRKEVMKWKTVSWSVHRGQGNISQSTKMFCCTDQTLACSAECKLVLYVSISLTSPAGLTHHTLNKSTNVSHKRMDRSKWEMTGIRNWHWYFPPGKTSHRHVKKQVAEWLQMHHQC